MIDISGLSREEKWELFERLWDDLASTHVDASIPDSHLRLIEERLAEHRRDPSQVRPAFEVLDELSRRYQ